MKRNFILIIISVVCLMSGCKVADQGQTTEMGKNESEQVTETQEPERIWSIMESYPPDIDSKDNPYRELNVATYITKIDGIYFINDCYHNQIIFHTSLSDKLKHWEIMTDEVHYAHTVASDGTVYLVDDTENNRVLVFDKVNNCFAHSQTFDNIGQWPHFIQYIEEVDAFYAWSSVTGEMYIFKRDKDTNRMYISDKKQIPELYGIYIRSFSIIDNEIYFASGFGNKKIIVANLKTLEVEKEYPVSDEIAGMAQVSKIQDYYYITVSTDANENQDYATIIRTDDLNKLQSGDYEDIYDLFTDNKGTPYYITEIDGVYYMTNHRTDDSIYSFEVVNNEIKNVKVVFGKYIEE